MLKSLLLSRKTVLTLILLMLGTVVAGYIFPQRFMTSPASMNGWQLSNPFWGMVSKKLALDHVYTSPWFAALLFVFLVSLFVSMWEQFRTALAKTSAGSNGGGRSLSTSASEDDIAGVIRGMGYRPAAQTGTCQRFVRNPWGYWGSFLLHLGIAITIASSLLIVLTEKRGVVHLVEGEIHERGAEWLKNEGGLLTGRFILPEDVRLDRVAPEFWDTDDLKQLTTDFTFLGPAGETSPYSMHINKTVRHRGIRAFQGKYNGSAFFVEFTDAAGKSYREIFELDIPRKRNKASQREFRLDWLPYRLQTKFYADADQQAMTGGTPLFVMQLADGKKKIAELSLKTGESGRLGPYNASLVQASRWGGLIFIDSTGMAGIFFGFFIIVLGGSLNYFCPPREFLLQRENDGWRVTWRATKFEHLYADEFACFVKRFGGDIPHEQ